MALPFPLASYKYSAKFGPAFGFIVFFLIIAGGLKEVGEWGLSSNCGGTRLVRATKEPFWEALGGVAQHLRALAVLADRTEGSGGHTMAKLHCFWI